MNRHAHLFLLCLALLLALPLALSGCGAGGKQSVYGQVSAVDATAKTFMLDGNDGKKYRFKAGSGVDLTHVKEHMDNKKEIKVEYSGTTPPYEASYAD